MDLLSVLMFYTQVLDGTRVALSTADGIHLGHNTFGSAPFRVTRAGAITSTSGTIGGWTLASNDLHSGSGSSYMILDQSNKKLRIGAKASLTDGKYWSACRNRWNSFRS